MGIEVILIPHIFHSSLRLFYKRTTRNLKGKDGGSLNLFSCGERCLQRETGHLAAGQETSGFSAICEGIHEGMGQFGIDSGLFHSFAGTKEIQKNTSIPKVINLASLKLSGNLRAMKAVMKHNTVRNTSNPNKVHKNSMEP
ncbi:unnamed protein product [Caretta caretta]